MRLSISYLLIGPHCSNLGHISHRFQNTVTYSLKLPTENCCQTAADGDMVTLDSL